MAAQMLGSQHVAMQSTWAALPADVVVPMLLRVPSQSRVLGRDAEHLLATIASHDHDPMAAAARYLLRASQQVHSGGQQVDIVRIIRSAIPTEIAERVHGTSRRIVVSSGWQAAFGARAPAAVADAHVHSGGVSPPLVLLRALLAHMSQLPVEGLALQLRDSDGATLNGEPLLLALGISAIALQAPPADLANLRRFDPALDLDVLEFWPFALGAAFSGNTDSLDRLRHAFDRRIWRRGGPPDVAAIECAIEEWLGGLASAPVQALGRGCLAALGLLQHALCAPAVASLDLFVERFDLLRRVRKMSSATEVVRIHDSISFLLGGGLLNRLELRKTAGAAVAAADKKARLDAYDGICNDIKNHAEAVVRVRKSHPNMTVQMPVSFHRHHPKAVQTSQGQAPLRHPLMNVRAIANGVARVCTERQEARDFIGSLDVVGRESDTPNWIFSLGYSYVDRAMRSVKVAPLAYTIHAGEQFACPLEGLRRIGEVLLFEVSVTRVGHALALSPTTADIAGLDGPHRASETLESLLWAARTVPALEPKVSDMCVRLGSIVFRGAVQPTFADLLDWYVSRFHYDRMQRIGFVADPSGFRVELVPAEEIVRTRTLSCADQVDKMIAASLLEGTFSGVDFNPNPFVPDEMLHELMSLMEVCYTQSVDVVRREFKKQRLIEACPSSNVSLGAIRSFAQHPVRDFAKAGLRVTMNSDDPGLFGALVEEEILSTLSSGALGNGRRAQKAMTAIIEDAMCTSASGITSAHCGEILAKLVPA